MKNMTYKSILFAATFVATLVACEKQEEPAPQPEDPVYTMVFTDGVREMKVTPDGAHEYAETIQQAEAEFTLVNVPSDFYYIDWGLDDGKQTNRRENLRKGVTCSFIFEKNTEYGMHVFHGMLKSASSASWTPIEIRDTFYVKSTPLVSVEGALNSALGTCPLSAKPSGVTLHPYELGYVELTCKPSGVMHDIVWISSDPEVFRFDPSKTVTTRNTTTNTAVFAVPYEMQNKEYGEATFTLSLSTGDSTVCSFCENVTVNPSKEVPPITEYTIEGGKHVIDVLYNINLNESTLFTTVTTPAIYSYMGTLDYARIEYGIIPEQARAVIEISDASARSLTLKGTRAGSAFLVMSINGLERTFTIGVKEK